MQIICSLFSLAGVLYFRGILRKESILILIRINILYLILFVGLYFSIFLTFIYCFLLYNFLFAISIKRTLYFKSSLSVLVVTFLEGLVVLLYLY